MKFSYKQIIGNSFLFPFFQSLPLPAFYPQYWIKQKDNDKKQCIKRRFLVGLGATSYGMLATFVKLAYGDKGITGNPFTLAEVISSQFVLGVITILIINAFQKVKKGNAVLKASANNIKQLMLAGTSTGLTGIFYYLVVKYIPVSIGIVLLMQTVWMGVLLEMILGEKTAF